MYTHIVKCSVHSEIGWTFISANYECHSYLRLETPPPTKLKGLVKMSALMMSGAPLRLGRLWLLCCIFKRSFDISKDHLE